MVGNYIDMVDNYTDMVDDYIDMVPIQPFFVLFAKHRNQVKCTPDFSSTL